MAKQERTTALPTVGANSITDMCLVVLAGRVVNPHLRRWSERFETRRVFRSSPFDHVACMRNRMIRWFLDDCTEPWLIMCDDDVVPTEGTEEFLRAAGDIVGARVWSRGGHESHRDSFTMAAVRLHRRVLQTIQPPWCDFSYSRDGCELTECECVYFWKKAQRSGFNSVRRGVFGHQFPVTVIPGDTGPSFLCDIDLRTTMRTRTSDRISGSRERGRSQGTSALPCHSLGEFDDTDS
jgi:hypothetical protein